MSERRKRGSYLYRGEQKRSPIFMISFLVFGLLIVVAFIIDFAGMADRRQNAAPDTTGELQRIVLGMGGKRYVDKKGFFSIERPTGWKVQTYPESKPYNVRFLGPNGADISITASKVEYNSFNTLVRHVKQIEKEYGINMNIETTEFLDRPVIKRATTLHHSKVISFDFLKDNVAHHIQLSTPHSMAEKYEPVLLDVINTYQLSTPAKS